MSSIRTFTVEIRGREITETVITDEKTAKYRANVDALTYFHSTVEHQLNVVVTIDDLNTFIYPNKVGTRAMELILQKNTPYAVTYHEHDRDHPGFFYPKEESLFNNTYIQIYNEKRQIYTEAIPSFEIYLQNKQDRRAGVWEQNGLRNRRNTPGSRIPGIVTKRRYGGKSKKHRKSKKHKKSNKRK